MNNKLIPIVLTLVVGIILAGSVLVPVLNDATKTEQTFTNDGYIRLGEISAEDTETYTITWTYENPGQFVINDDVYVMPSGSTTGSVFPYTLFATDGWGLRYLKNSTDTNLNLYGSGESASLLWYAGATAQDTVVITLSAGSATFVKNSTTTATMEYTNVFLPDSDGAYVLKKGDTSAYLNADSVIYSTGRTSAVFGTNNIAININLNGNVEGVEVDAIAPTGFTVSNVVVDSSEVNGYKDLYKFDKVTFDITQTSTSIDVEAVYSQVIVPYQVTAELSDHLTPGQIALLGAIPVLVIVALLVVAVGVVARRND